MASEWDDLKRAAKRATQGQTRERLWMYADDILRLIAQAERAERLEQVDWAMVCKDSGLAAHHAEDIADAVMLQLRAALKGGE